MSSRVWYWRMRSLRPCSPPSEAVEVVRRDVQHAGDVRAALRGLELRVAHLEHDPGLRRDLVEQAEQPDADVAADDVLAPSGGEHRADERRRGRLAAAAGDADDGPGQQLEEELVIELTGTPRSRAASSAGQRQRHALGDEDQVGSRYVVDAVLAQREADGQRRRAPGSGARALRGTWRRRR